MDTYVVRVWRGALAERAPEPDELHGTVQHVGSGAEAAFTNVDQLASLLQPRSDAAAVPRWRLLPSG